LLLAEGLLRVFLALAPTGIPFFGRAGLDLRIAVFTALLALVCAAIFGLLPALQTPRAVALAARATHSRKRALLRRSLAAGQIAVSMVLLTGAALLLRSFENIEQQKLGFEAQGVLTARVALPGFLYDTAQKQMEFYLQTEAALRRLPGVRAVGISDSLPPGGWNSGRHFSDLAAEGKAHAPLRSGDTVVVRRVTPDYFAALNIPVVRGRNFTEEDRHSGESLVIVSRLLADYMFPGEDPIGKRIQAGRDVRWHTVVGVAENVKNGGLVEPDNPEIYFLRSSIASNWSGRVPLMIVDSVLSPKATVPWVRSQIAQLDSTVPVTTEPLND
jgi:hypothetical protein